LPYIGADFSVFRLIHKRPLPPQCERSSPELVTAFCDAERKKSFDLNLQPRQK
jgi:hypothetical protein